MAQSALKGSLVQWSQAGNGDFDQTEEGCQEVGTLELWLGVPAKGGHGALAKQRARCAARGPGRRPVSKGWCGGESSVRGSSQPHSALAASRRRPGVDMVMLYSPGDGHSECSCLVPISLPMTPHQLPSPNWPKGQPHKQGPHGWPSKRGGFPGTMHVPAPGSTPIPAICMALPVCAPGETTLRQQPCGHAHPALATPTQPSGHAHTPS